MIARTFIDATDLNLWATRIETQGLLPRLLRRLIYGTVKDIERIDFRSEEGVQLSGWDGSLKVEKGNAFVPSGHSLWEISTNANIKGKADDDYEKRTSDPLDVNPADCVFIFVTPRRWPGKNDWMEGRQAEGIWREVRAFDGDDLATWLEVAPGVHIWLSILLGKHPLGVTDFSNYWHGWSEATNPPITAALAISGRKTEADRVRTWLSEDPSTLGLQADSREEAMAFVAAALYELPTEERERYLAGSIVIRDLASWQQLVASSEPLLLAPVFEDRNTVTLAVRQGHHVLVPLGKDDSISSETVTLPRLHRECAKQALIQMGIDEEKSDDLATLARRSMMALRRKLAIRPEVQRPAWAKPSEARALLPVMLSGGWNDKLAGDREVIARLARTTYEEVNSLLARWANESDPPVRRVGDTWLLVSREDSWNLLAKFLTRDDLENFENVIIEALGEIDPSFDMPADQRYLAGVVGKSLPHSGLLREGLAEAVAVMGARSDSTVFADSVSGQERANRIVRRLLDGANNNWRVWASISYYLPLLAEAAPEVFLASVENGLAGDDPLLLNLFDEGKNSLFSSSPHTGLLWALERLAWNPPYLGHAALLLAKLARIDPGGKLGNRPDKSLREIFVCWHPQTSADFEKRLKVLDAIRAREPRVAWRLLCALLPELHAVATPTARPDWREWTIDQRPKITYAELFAAEREIVTRLLDSVGAHGQYWADLIHRIDTLQKPQLDAVVERLLSVDVESFNAEDSHLLRNTLRDVISRHRQFPDADWALPSELIDQLHKAYERFEPQDLVSRHSWIFSSSPQLLQPSRSDWQEWNTELETMMLNAACAINAEGGLHMLLKLAASVEQPGSIGFVLGKNGLLVDEEKRILNEELACEDGPQRAFACGFITGRINGQGWTWIDSKLSSTSLEGWSPEQRAIFFACLPFESRTWDIVDTSDEPTQNRYWSRVGAYMLANNADCERAAINLTKHGRPDAAVDLIALRTHNKECKVSISTAVEALEQLARLERTVNWGAIQFDVVQVMKLVDASGEIEASRMAALEWAFLPILENYGNPNTLHRELSDNPDFFVEIATLIFPPKDGEKREVSEQNRTRGELAYTLLKSWHGCPGCHNGSIDGEVTREWVSRVRGAMHKLGLAKIGDELIGEVIASTPSDPDGAWPHSVIRDLVEELSSQDIERGIEVAIYNRRGAFMKSLTEGGIQERQLAERYADYARKVSDRWPRTTAVLRSISDTYSSEARREDVNAELTEDLWR